MTTIGIDPGVHGAIAVLSDVGNLIEVHDMPIFVVSRKAPGGKTKNTSSVNVHELGDILRPHADATAVIENVGPMPNDSRMSAFRFGSSTGALHGACGAFQMQISSPRPQDWKSTSNSPPPRATPANSPRAASRPMPTCSSG